MIVIPKLERLSDVVTSTSGPGSSKINLPKHHGFEGGATVMEADFSVKMAFLRRLFGIFSAQLIFCTSVTTLFLFTPITRFYINENPWLVTVAFLLCPVLIFSLVIKRKESPANSILLVLFTLAEAYSLAVIVAFYDQLVILQTLILVADTAFLLCLYTYQTKWDFMTRVIGLYAFFWIIVTDVFLRMMLGSTYLEVVFSSFGAIVLILYVINDVPKIMKKRSPEEFVVGVIDLYLDVVNIFPCIYYKYVQLRRRFNLCS